jgi:hypothetical protein
MTNKDIITRAQYWANVTKQTTLGYRVSNGRVHFTIEGFPIKGDLIARVEPSLVIKRKAA